MRLQIVLLAFFLACAVILVMLPSEVEGQKNKFRSRNSPSRRNNRKFKRNKNRNRVSCKPNERRKRGKCIPKEQDTKGLGAVSKKSLHRSNKGGDKPSLNEVIAIASRWVAADRERIPNMVQLVFHSCVGGCDGCINTATSSNKGLRGSYSLVQALWKKEVKQAISFADFVVLLGSQAVEHGMKASGGPGARNVPFKTGRKSCADPANYNRALTFPQGENTDGLDFLVREFGVSRVEAMALLGAHSLGQCRTENSGFEGKWDNTPFVLDNAYYRSMDGTLWDITTAPGNSHTQWTDRSPDRRMMLNADMAILKDFEIRNGQPSCGRTSNDCPNLGGSMASTFRSFINNEQLWASTFVQAFVQMVKN